ncbi:MAG TPA: glycosyltransferase family 39 protein [Sphingomonas sp.]|nr:glycosyltransferase family 39 protein [Sphingomonas sp.]
MIATPSRPRPILVAALLGLLAEALFLFRVEVPHGLVFDEVHYVPAARTMLALLQPVNTEHPLLGKAIIAAGIALFGDNSLGWRFFSTVAGAATVTALFAIVWQLIGRLRPAVLTAVFATLSVTLFVQSRIAMLDGFMAAFLLAGIAVLLASMRASGWRALTGVALGGALLGLAIGCKWAAVPFLGYAGLAILVIRRRDVHRRHWLGVATPWLLLALGLAAVAVYLLTFLPAFFYARDPLTLATLLPFQRTMYAEQTQVLPAHTYQSGWWSWPLMLRPIWYFYEPADGAMRGILMIGNPAILWGGLVGVGACLWAAARDRSARMAAIPVLWIGAYLPWIVIPKSLGFFYYYFVPSLFLCPALAVVLDRYVPKRGQAVFLTLTAALFAYFYPIAAAMPLDGPDAFRHWTWFASWI